MERKLVLVRTVRVLCGLLEAEGFKFRFEDGRCSAMFASEIEARLAIAKAIDELRRGSVMPWHGRN